MPPPGAPSSPRMTHLAPSRHAHQSSSNSTSSTSLSAMPASSGSQTITATNTPSPEPELVLRLRGAHDSTIQSSTGRRRRIQWAEGTVDNEGLGRKKSKVCCIYHKEHPVGESSDESSSSSDDSESDRDDGSARMIGGKRKGRGHDDGEDCGHGQEHEHGKARSKRKPSPNAYEKMPKYDIKSLKQVDKAGV